jgi:short-subunit dehydrogenase
VLLKGAERPMAKARPVTLITGASSGIGAEIARVFAAHGHELVLVARREAELRLLADEIGKTASYRPTILAFDLTRQDAVAQISDALRDLDLEPQFVVNSAGFGILGHAAELDSSLQLRMIDLNVRALTDLSARFTDSLERNRGGILNVASVLAFLPGPEMAVYHATKSYVLSFSEALHEELGAKRIRVTTLCPGPVDTQFQVRADGNLARRLVRSAERVAREGYEGLMSGQRVVVPGTITRIFSILSRLVPRSVMFDLLTSSRRRPHSP